MIDAHTRPRTAFHTGSRTLYAQCCNRCCVVACGGGVQRCFSSEFVKGTDQTLDYYSCDECKCNWICKARVAAAMCPSPLLTFAHQLSQSLTFCRRVVTTATPNTQPDCTFEGTNRRTRAVIVRRRSCVR